jgi:1-deoxy-D-xylulose-5-phosphate synthase
MNSPVLIRYPKGFASEIPSAGKETLHCGKSVVVKDGKDVMLWAAGGEVRTALKISELLKEKGIDAGVVNVRFLKPFDTELLIAHASSRYISTIENCQISGGLAALTDQVLINRKHKKILHFGWDDSIIPHGTAEGIRKKYNLTPEAVAEKISVELRQDHKQ